MEIESFVPPVPIDALTLSVTFVASVLCIVTSISVSVDFIFDSDFDSVAPGFCGFSSCGLGDVDCEGAGTAAKGLDREALNWLSLFLSSKKTILEQDVSSFNDSSAIG